MIVQSGLFYLYTFMQNPLLFGQHQFVIEKQQMN